MLIPLSVSTLWEVDLSAFFGASSARTTCSKGSGVRVGVDSQANSSSSDISGEVRKLVFWFPPSCSPKFLEWAHEEGTKGEGVGAYFLKACKSRGGRTRGDGASGDWMNLLSPEIT